MSENNNLAAILIPVYEEVLTELEILALKQCYSIFRDRTILLIAPEHLELKEYKKLMGDGVKVMRFPSEYFSSLEGYNKLLLSATFYEKFSVFEYILIYQLDSYVFSDDLDDWCDGRYDYVGAPWINASWLKSRQVLARRLSLKGRSFIERFLSKFRWLIKGYYFKNTLAVGNGGFSLRKVNSFSMISSRIQPQEFWTHNEDIFWGIYVPHNFSTFKVPSMIKAAKFAFDLNPALLFNITGKLPMGCHAWSRSDLPYGENKQFYKKFIPGSSIHENKSGLSHELS
jgi:hypothetical protein